MSLRVPSASVCVVDDDEEEFGVILEVLARLSLPAVHFRGDDLDALPPEGKPLRGVRLIFTDLNINNASHKMALGYTAKVFSRIVSQENGPVFAVVWSKHADEADAADGRSNLEKFTEILFSENPKYHGRVFLESLPKPLGLKRSTEVLEKFERQVTELLGQWPAFDFLLRWESALQEATLKTSLSPSTTARVNPDPGECVAAA